jgi:colanic acid/amylovoran biosynthesis glycosyltransferase
MIGKSSMSGAERDEGRVVAIWRDEWLPISETFVVNQLTALRKWKPFTVGLRTVTPSLPVVPDFAPFSLSGLRGTIVRRSARWAYFGRFERILKERGTSVIHAHFGSGGIAVLDVARRARLPLVVTFHGRDATADVRIPGRAGRRYRAGLKRLFANATIIIAVSEAIKAQLLALDAPEEKIRVHYIGLLLSDDDRRPLVETSRSGILFVGRLVEKKGAEDLLEAVALLDPTLRDATPVKIVGDGPLRLTLERRAHELGLENVRFLGSQTPAQVTSLMGSAEIFCLPSKTAEDGDTEGLPIVLLEAALYGAVIISTRHSGIPEFVWNSQTGLLAPESSPAILSGHIASVLTDAPLASRLRAAARERLLTEFDMRKQADELEQIYEAAVAYWSVL